MRKNGKNQTIWHRLRRQMAGVLVLALMLGLLPGLTVTAEAASQHWAMPYAQQLMDWNVMRGDTNGALRLDSSITRAEFVAMMNRAYGYDQLGSMPFTDVRSRDWFYDDINIAYNVGYFKGTAPTRAEPNSPLTREQAAVLLSRNLMLKGTTGETLGFSDSRSLSDWSRGLIGAAVAEGVIGGYSDGTFQPTRNITRGEVAAMLARAIGTYVGEEGVHNLGSVYGNVTVNTSGVTLRNAVIAGNLYLTGGIDLGDVLLENVEVLGRIVVSGAGESNSSKNSVILRNVTADEMVVDSIANQFVSLRAEGHTDIPTTTVRTNAYLEDASAAGHGLALIQQDGDEPTLLQLAGELKEIINFTPNSTLQIAEGYAEKVTVDEHARDSKVIIDNGGRVGELSLDVAAAVTGAGDIKNLNVGAAGSKVEMLPDQITIRPGITSDIHGTTMDTVTAKESSADPKLMAGYPQVKNIAPNSATVVFKTNKAGTIHWALTAVSDGSVSEKDLIEPPVYGNRILKAGTVKAAASNTEYTAQVSGLTPDGSYYVSAVLVDDRDNRSPVKVAAFTTPDNTTPAFTSGYPYMSKTRVDLSQVTAMTNKSCRLYYALLSSGSATPTTAELKAGAVSGNWGYGTVNMVKNTTQPIQVNGVMLEEVTKYDLYLWLTDYDGAKSSAVRKITFTTDDKTPPIVTDLWQHDFKANTAGITYRLNEPGTLYWAVVAEGDKAFITDSERDEKGLLTGKATKIKVESGAGAITKGSSNASKAESDIKFTIPQLNSKTTGTNNYTLYYVAKDKAGNYAEEVKSYSVRTLDTEAPTVTQEFTKPNGNKKNEAMADTDVRLVFSESVKGDAGDEKVFMELYQKVQEALRTANRNENDTNVKTARETLGKALHDHIKLINVPTLGSPAEVKVRDENNENTVGADWIIDYRYAKVEMDDTSMVITFPTVQGSPYSALKLKSGAEYFFRLEGIYDTALPKANQLNKQNRTELDRFKTVFAQVNVNLGTTPSITSVETGTVPTGGRIDFNFVLEPVSTDRVEDDKYWDMLIWTNTTMTYALYYREGTGAWKRAGEANVNVDGAPNGHSYRSLTRHFLKGSFGQLNKLSKDVEYAIHVTSIDGNPDPTAWTQRVVVEIMVAAGSTLALSNLANGSYEEHWTSAQVDEGVASIGNPDPRTIRKQFSDSNYPQLVANYPVITAGDIGAEMEVMLDRPGTVYYVAVPVGSYKKDTADVTPSGPLTIDKLADITSYTTPVVPTAAGFGVTNASSEGSIKQTITAADTLTGGKLPKPGSVPAAGGAKVAEGTDRLLLSEPAVNTVTGGSFGNSRVRWGSITLGANVSDTVNLNKRGNTTADLEPNTLYYVYIATKGTTDIFSKYAECYRFITSESERPSINAAISGTNVNITVDRSTDLDYILVLRGSESKLTLGDSNNSTIASETFWDNNSTASTESTNYPSVKSILDAMSTPYSERDSNGREVYKGSVFDKYATADAKRAVATLIRNQAVNGNDIVMNSAPTPKRVTVANNGRPGNQITCTGMVGQNYYTFLAVGKSTMGSGDAFRATYSVHNQDTTPPVITSGNLYVEETNTAGDQITKGTLTLVFNEPLYKRQQNAGTSTQSYLPLDNCPRLDSNHTGTVTQTYFALGNMVTTLGRTGITVVTEIDKKGKVVGHNQGISTITLEIENAKAGASISFDASLCDGSGNNREEEPLTVSLTYNTKTKAWGYTITSAWDGRTNKS